MQLIPAIDLLNGRVVRLRQGRYDDVTTYSASPEEIAAAWRGKVECLHVVDLQGARRGVRQEAQTIRAIVGSFGAGVQVGGGVRSLEVIREYFALGVERVVLGTAAISDPALVSRAAGEFPQRIVVAVDARGGIVTTDGWERSSGRTATELVRELDTLPLAAVLYTDVERDGMEVGPNVAETSKLALATRTPVIASGGVGSLEHLTALARAPGPIAAVVVGRALHEERFSLDEAVSAVMVPSP